MFLLKTIFVSLVLPPVGPLLLALVGFWLMHLRPTAGKILLGSGLALLLILSTPWVSFQLLTSLEDAPALEATELQKAQAIVVLAGEVRRNAPEYGGHTVGALTLERLRYGARLARQSGLPVALAGGSPTGGTSAATLMREVMETDFRVATRWLEKNSINTTENAEYLAPMLKEAGITHIALVTHGWHMTRARAAFERQGLIVIAAPTGLVGGTPSSIYRWIPGADALNDSRVALHEWVGLAATRIASLFG